MWDGTPHNKANQADSATPPLNLKFESVTSELGGLQATAGVEVTIDASELENIDEALLQVTLTLCLTLTLTS